MRANMPSLEASASPESGAVEGGFAVFFLPPKSFIMEGSRLEFIAKPELLYPETNAFKSTRPSESGDLTGIDQDRLTLVSL
jgi:hypothetical protein